MSAATALPPTLPLSARLRATAAPPIPAARRWAAAYDGGAGPLLDLTQAVPGYPPPPALLARLAEAAGEASSATYGPIEGDEALREALAADVAATYAAAVTAEDVVITAGCNLAFSLAMPVMAGSGEAVMLPTPWYFNHRMALEIAGIGAVPLPCAAADGFVPDPDRAAALLEANPQVRALVLITPNNPTGAIIPPETLARFAALCRTRGVWLVLDETYRDFLPGREAPHGLFADPSWRDGIVQLYSFSKSYCVPGHRLGAILAGPSFRAELAKSVDTLQICPPRAAQKAVAWAVPALREWREGNRDLMGRRASAFARLMTPIGHRWHVDALGGYFAYLRLPDGAPDALEAAEILASRHGLLTLPGPFFGPGQERHLRLAFANAPEEALADLPARLSGLG
ncbi:aminotransferase [Roseomonas gilardii]|uniref:aspartate transaminase n=1 Tax=Roseomonas gilardii TaxID=257708 RepID=A0ABU3MI46_9PROT|nr:aminotransferase [Roseomonas gilardii]MDT8332506.1 aminotransferase [Roseomonas gilardii]